MAHAELRPTLLDPICLYALLLCSLAFSLQYAHVIPWDLQKENQAIESVKSALEILNKHLTKQTYLVGDNVTLADLITYCQLWNGYKKVTPIYPTSGSRPSRAVYQNCSKLTLILVIWSPQMHLARLQCASVLMQRSNRY